mgnify:CR=1 FL=1
MQSPPSDLQLESRGRTLARELNEAHKRPRKGVPSWFGTLFKGLVETDFNDELTRIEMQNELTVQPGDLRALSAVARFPARARCALLPAEAMGRALGG